MSYSGLVREGTSDFISVLHDASQQQRFGFVDGCTFPLDTDSRFVQRIVLISMGGHRQMILDDLGRETIELAMCSLFLVDRT